MTNRGQNLFIAQNNFQHVFSNTSYEQVVPTYFCIVFLLLRQNNPLS